MMYKSVNRGGGRHGIFENLVPVREGKVAGDNYTAPLVAFRKENEENIRLIASLGYVGQVVDDESLKAVESLYELVEGEFSFCTKQLLNQGSGRGVEDRASLQAPLSPESNREVRLAGTGLTKDD